MADNRIYSSKIERPVDFSGLPKVGPCSPSDIDVPEIPFCIEVGAIKKYMIGDFKDHGKWFRDYDGQQLLLQRHVEAFKSYGYSAGAFLAWHPPEVKIIDAASSIVVFIYVDGTWEKPKIQQTLRKLYCAFFEIKEAHHQMVQA